MLRVKKLSETAVLPVRGSVFAAGYDLASAVDTIVPANGKAIVKTDLAIAIPENTYARIAPRSGLAVKHFIDVGAGVVDYDYRGNVGVVLFNHSDVDFTVKQSDRIAQLILENISMVPVEEVSELPSSERGDGGFGSTGTESHKIEVDMNSSTLKRFKPDESASSLDDLILFIHSVSDVVGQDRKTKMKSLVLNGGGDKVRAIMAEYLHTNSSADLNQSVDLVV